MGMLGQDDCRQHFSGLAARLLFDFLDSALGAEATAAVIAAAAQGRSRSKLAEDTSWFSFGEFRTLLEAAAVALGGPEQLARVGDRPPAIPDSTATAQDAVHDLGSPDILYAGLNDANRATWTVISVVTEQIGEREWRITSSLHPDFEPYPELCFFVDGIVRMVPTVWGHPPAEAVHEQCRCEGQSACVTRLRWFPADGSESRIKYLEGRVRTLEARLRVLQGTVHELVSGTSLDELLGRIISSAAGAVNAPEYVLVLSPPDGRVKSLNVDPVEATRVAERALAGDLHRDGSYLAVDVASPRRNYGKLIAINTKPGQFLESERVVLGVYASLAAAALDSSAALEEARQQANTARALLDLSVSLTELTTAEETAARVIRAVKIMVDCDRAILLLADPDSGELRIAAEVGMPAEVSRFSRDFAVALDAGSITKDVWFFDMTKDHHPETADLLAAAGVIAAATMPILADGKLIGLICVGVTHRPERLDVESLKARLRGLAAQAANAIANTRLVDQVRHQALHDALTGLPNRALILDRAEHLLIRARREQSEPAALFIDLDNFKTINDTFGHAAGDQLLKAVATRVGGALRACETIGRLGGDEFVVLTEGDSLSADPQLIAERIANVLREPFLLPCIGKPFNVSASIGIASGDRLSAEQLLRDADIALYRAKSAGKGSYVRF